MEGKNHSTLRKDYKKKNRPFEQKKKKKLVWRRITGLHLAGEEGEGKRLKGLPDSEIRKWRKPSGKLLGEDEGEKIYVASSPTVKELGGPQKIEEGEKNSTS